MGTRGHEGGLAEATLQAALVLDAAGKAVVFLETVGTGQSEIGILSMADTVLLVLQPGAGDAVQALKAGIMEIPDLIAINKRDLERATATLAEVRQMLALGGKQPPPIVLTQAQTGEGVEELVSAVKAHKAGLEGNGALTQRRGHNLAAEVFAVASARARRHLDRAVRNDPELARLLDEVGSRTIDPLTAVHEILRKVFRIDEEDSTGSESGGVNAG
jgi:LAO/AO transport system kinase